MARVVLVDDTEDLRLLVRLALELTGEYEVVGEAGDGLEAVDVVTATRPDAVVLDLAMPRMDGLETITALHAVAPDVRILVLSGFTQTRMGEVAVSLCADAYLEKTSGMSTDVAAHLDRILRSPPKSCAAAVPVGDG